MRVLSTDLGSAVEHLPPASVLSLDGITWDEYLRVLDEFVERPGLRITYSDGQLDLVTTSPGHERWKEFVQDLVSRLCEESGLDLESYGGMTQISPLHEKGVEPDTCFYVANAARMRGRDEIDITLDPPPDVVVEIDKSSQSLRKFPIYATFGVPEIWVCDIRRKRLRMFGLRNGEYVESAASRFFPSLTGEILVRFIERSRSEGQIQVLMAFREWLRASAR